MAPRRRPNGKLVSLDLLPLALRDHLTGGHGRKCAPARHIWRAGVHAQTLLVYTSSSFGSAFDGRHPDQSVSRLGLGRQITPSILLTIYNGYLNRIKHSAANFAYGALSTL